MNTADSPRPGESTPDTPDTQPQWYRVGIGDLLLLMLLAGIGQTASRGLIGDPGIGWHLRTPELVFEHGWPTADPFSGPKHGNYWLANQWLGDVPFWLGWKAAGMNGVIAVTIALLLLAYRLVYGFLRADGLSWAAAALWTYLAASGSFFAWAARPNVFTFLSVLILARVLSLHHEGRLAPRRLLWLVPLFACWVNCHGGFVIGLVMIGLAAAVELPIAFLHSAPTARAKAMGRFRRLAGAGTICFVATLVNPYGWKIYPWVFSLLGDEYFMNLNQEWLSTDFHKPGTGRVAVFILLFPVVFAASRWRPTITLLALSLMWLYLGLQSQRYMPLWVVVTTPLMARAAANIAWVNDRVSRFGQDDLLRTRSGGWIGLLAITLGLAVWANRAQPVDHDHVIYPSEGLRELLHRRQPGEAVLNHPNFGGFLILHGGPDLRVWIDDRNEVYGQAWYEAYFDLEQTKPGWEKTLAGWNPDWIAIPPETPLAYRLAERPVAWERVYGDGLVTLFRKRVP